MYKWDRDLLHRALDLQMEAMEKNKEMKIDFPYAAKGGVVDFITKWNFKKSPGNMGKNIWDNEGLREELDKLEKELQKSEGNEPGGEKTTE